jgi:hypothetical protein
MSRIETSEQGFSSPVACGVLGVAGMTDSATSTGKSAPAGTAMETDRMLGLFSESVSRFVTGTDEFTVCTVDLGGTLSCAVTGGR